MPEWFQEYSTLFGALMVLAAWWIGRVASGDGTSDRVWLSALEDGLFEVGLAFWTWGMASPIRLENEDASRGRLQKLTKLLGRIGPVLVIIGVILHVAGLQGTSLVSDAIRLYGLGACALALVLALTCRWLARTRPRSA